ncbi:hypothetical protein SASPL_130570 [Salvia splendens]|uniref:Uncharacterized protein n=1 Tax=Salvia splendens TaxID=180675 RepID=A0A8X8ZK56_SALSN|nr:hypothetical protein SASPL_130570 [Salvia splendens]
MIFTQTYKRKLDSMEEDKDRLVETDRLERGLLLDRAPDSGQFNNDDDEELPPLYIASASACSCSFICLCAEEGAEHDEEVKLVELPDVSGGGEIDEADDGGDDDGPEHEVRGVVEERHEEEERDHHHSHLVRS